MSEYTLGATSSEQERLRRQRMLYADTLDLDFSACKSVVELGCGPLVNGWIAQQLQSGRFVGIDNQEAQVAAGRLAAAELGLSNVELFNRDAAVTGLDGQSADAVFARCLLVHLSSPSPVVQEMYRLLETGGKAVIIEPDDETVFASPGYDNLVACWRAKTEYTVSTRHTDKHVSRKLEGLLRVAGFSQVRVEPHVVSYTGQQPEECGALLTNWMAMIERVGSELIQSELLSVDKLIKARREAAAVKPDCTATLTMWRATAIK